MLYNKNDFTKENLDFFLGELAKRFQKQNGKMAVAEIVLIGGAAILAGYNFRESTNDIDAIVASNASLKTCVNSITDEYGLSNGWFNSDFVKTESFSQKLPQYSKHYKNFNRNFSVRIITGEYLVAMKLRSFRPYKKDQSDILGILQYHKNIGKPLSEDVIIEAFGNLYGQEYKLPTSTIRFLHEAIISDNLQELYERTLSQEKRNKELLIDFESEYEGVLNSDNLGDILSTLQKKQ